MRANKKIDFQKKSFEVLVVKKYKYGNLNQLKYSGRYKGHIAVLSAHYQLDSVLFTFSYT